MSKVGAIYFAGYDLPEVLHEEGEAVLVRCVRRDDGEPILAWVSREEPPTRRLLDRLQHERVVLQHLAENIEERGEGRAAPLPLGLERDGTAVALILEDPGGVALEQLLEG